VQGYRRFIPQYRQLFGIAMVYPKTLARSVRWRRNSLAWKLVEKVLNYLEAVG